MDVSFLFSRDELYTLICRHDLTEAGKCFIDSVLSPAKETDLSRLIEKRFASRREDGVALEPVISMLIESIAKADAFIVGAGYWETTSAWVLLRCERDTYARHLLKITPMPPIAEQ